MLNRLRWWLFRQICRIGWMVCPEPHRSRLYRAIGHWDVVNERIKVDLALKARDLKDKP